MPTIDLCEEEVLDAINSLDTYSRVWMGQFSHLDPVWRMWRFTTYSQSRESRILPVPSTECHLLDDGSSAMRLSLEGSSLRLLLDALLAYDHLLALRVVALMQIFTRDNRVLAIAQMVEDILRDASLRAYEGLGKHQEDLKELVARVAALAMADIGKGYRSLALERADSGEPLTHGERRNARLT
jgi:hypothetical protein